MSTELENTEPQATSGSPTGQEPGKKPEDEKKFTQSELDAILQKRLAEKEASDKKKADEAKAKAEAEALVKNAEWEKLAKAKEAEAEALKAQLAEKELNEKRRAIAEEIGLPAAFAGRIQGKTEDEMKADAKVLLGAMPKIDPKKNPGVVTNPANANGAQSETDADRRRRLGLR